MPLPSKIQRSSAWQFALSPYKRPKGGTTALFAPMIMSVNNHCSRQSSPSRWTVNNGCTRHCRYPEDDTLATTRLFLAALLSCTTTRCFLQLTLLARAPVLSLKGFVWLGKAPANAAQGFLRPSISPTKLMRADLPAESAAHSRWHDMTRTCLASDHGFVGPHLAWKATLRTNWVNQTDPWKARIRGMLFLTLRQIAACPSRVLQQTGIAWSPPLPTAVRYQTHTLSLAVAAHMRTAEGETARHNHECQWQDATR